MIKKSCIFSFRARKKRSAEVLVSNVFFAFTEDIFLNYSKRIRPKAYETTEKEFLLIGLLFISFMNNSTIYIFHWRVHFWISITKNLHLHLTRALFKMTTQIYKFNNILIDCVVVLLY